MTQDTGDILVAAGPLIVVQKPPCQPTAAAANRAWGVASTYSDHLPSGESPPTGETPPLLTSLDTDPRAVRAARPFAKKRHKAQSPQHTSGTADSSDVQG
jgi:hypothetical protein